MVRDFKRSLQKDGELITIKYYMRKPGLFVDNWQQSDGVVWQYSNIKCLKEIVSQLTFGDGGVANVIFGKVNFFCDYNDCDFNDNNKRYINIVDERGLIYPIDKVVPMVRIGASYMAYMFIQK